MISQQLADDQIIRYIEEPSYSFSLRSTICSYKSHPKLTQHLQKTHPGMIVRRVLALNGDAYLLEVSSLMNDEDVIRVEAFYRDPTLRTYNPVRWAKSMANRIDSFRATYYRNLGLYQ